MFRLLFISFFTITFLFSSDIAIVKKAMGEVFAKRTDNLVKLNVGDQLQVGDEGAALASVERDQLVDVVKNILSTFKEREQLVIQFYYFEELTLKEISEILNITESRISQIHKAVIHKIKESVGE